MIKVATDVKWMRIIGAAFLAVFAWFFTQTTTDLRVLREQTAQIAVAVGVQVTHQRITSFRILAVNEAEAVSPPLRSEYASP